MSIVGTFTTREQARDAVDSLIAAGEPPDAMSAITPADDSATLTETAGERLGQVANHASVGAILGAAAGVVAAIALPGVGAVLAAGPLVLGGAMAGGLAGAWTRLGFADEHAEYLTERLKAGRFLVVVHTSPASSVGQIESTLMNSGAEDVRVAVTRDASS